MNLVKLATELEYVPKDQLAQMSQDPNASYPPYLVLAEIQRRTQNEKAYAAAQPKPTSTVAEEVVGEFVQPKGLQAGMPSESAPTDAFSSESMGMPASAPMQQPMMMAGGGLTEYVNGGVTEEDIDEIVIARPRQDFIFNTDLQDIMNYSEDFGDFKQKVRLFKDLDKMLLEGEISEDEYNYRRLKIDELDRSWRQQYNERKGLASGGLTAYANGGSLDQSFDDPYANVLGSSTNPYPVDQEQKNFLADRYTNEDGSIDYGTAIFDGIDATALAFILAPEPVSSGLGAVGRGLSWAGRGLMNFVRSPKKLYDETARKIGTKKIIKGEADVPTGGTVPYNPNVARDLGKPVLNKRITQGGVGAYVGSKFLPKGEEVIEPEDKDKDKDKDKLLDELRDKATGMAKPKREIDYDLVGLGGLIMGSRNMSELGMGLAGLAERKQAREDALLEGQAKDDYYKASAEKVRAEIEGLPLENKMEALEQVNDLLTKALEGEIELTEEQLSYYNLASQTLTSQILALQGIDANSLTGPDPLEAARI